MKYKYEKKDFDKYSLELIGNGTMKVKDIASCINEDGYKVETSIKKLREGNTPQIFANSRYALENIKKYMISEGCEFLDDFYNPRQKSNFITQCGHAVCEYFIVFRKGSYRACKECRESNGNKFSQRMKIETENFLKSFDCALLKKYSQGSSTFVEYIGKCGHLVKRSTANLKAVKFPELCSDCGKKKNKGNKRGGTTLKLAEENKEEWSSIDCIVYIVNMFNDNESFYKIGLTKNKPHKRLGHMPYRKNKKNRIYIKTNLYDAVYIEKELHELNSELRYEPKLFFKGHTECFSEISSKTMDKIIKLEKGGVSYE